MGVYFLLALYHALKHALCNVFGSLDGPGLLDFNTVGACSKEVGVGAYGVQAGHLHVAGHFQTDRLLEAVHTELGTGVQCVAGQCHLADAADGVARMTVAAVQVVQVLGVHVSGAQSVAVVDVFYAPPLIRGRQENALR